MKTTECDHGRKRDKETHGPTTKEFRVDFIMLPHITRLLHSLARVISYRRHHPYLLPRVDRRSVQQTHIHQVHITGFARHFHD